MEQHPIPQQITSYEFKLVGEMTLKQFLKAAAGIVIAVLINASSLVFFLKYPLMLVFGGGGLMLAFVPFEDRPLEQWIIAFIKSIYSPTIYTYKKTASRDWLELKDKSAAETLEKNKKEKEESDEIIRKDKVKVSEFIKSLPSVKKSETLEKVEEKPTETTEDDLKKIAEAMAIKETDKAVEVKTPVTSETEKKTEEVVEKDWREDRTNLNLQKEKLAATGEVTFGEIPMPDKPDIANLVVGMVTDIQGKIVEGAIVEIQDDKGNPTRVLKTNPLGQFRATTPLANGGYLVIPEKEGYKFDRVSIKLSGEIVEPIKIKAVA